MTVLALKNPRNAIGGPAPVNACTLAIRNALFDIAAAQVAGAYGSGSVAPVMGVGDTIEIGVVPAGCKLVPALSHGNVPILDSNGSPLAQYSIGTGTTAAALKAPATAAAAVIIKPGDLLTTAGAEIGSASVDVPILMTFTVASVTPAVIGQIKLHMGLRAFDANAGDVEVL